MKTNKKYNLNNYFLILEMVVITLLTTVSYFFTQEVWILVLGGVIVTVVILFSFLERRKYEKELEQIAEYVDKLISGRIIESSGSMTDNMSAKLSHQLSKLQNIIIKNSENAKKDKQEIRDLIVEIAHQLRMPIANIDTYLELLNGNDFGETEKRKYIEAIDISKNKLIFLIESFIKMSRLENNVIQIRKNNTDLRNTINEEIINIKDKADQKNISVVFDCAKDLSVPHDKNWLGESVFNLLDNSIKYSNPDSVVHISVTANEMFTEVRIKDEGYPIPVEEEHLIFKRFYRGSNVNDQEGFGLGLYLTREIILKHDGFMKFKNIENGHMFSIFLPT